MLCVHPQFTPTIVVQAGLAELNMPAGIQAQTDGLPSGSWFGQ